MKKSELRKHLRSLYEGDQARNAQSKKLCEHILTSDVYQHSQVIAGYMPLSYEADVMPVITEALRCGKKLVLPLCSKPPEMTLRLENTVCRSLLLQHH